MIKGLELEYLHILDLQINILNNQYKKLDEPRKQSYLIMLINKIGESAFRGIFNISDKCFDMGYNFLLYLTNLRKQESMLSWFNALDYLDNLLFDIMDYTNNHI